MFLSRTQNPVDKKIFFYYFKMLNFKFPRFDPHGLYMLLLWSMLAWPSFFSLLTSHSSFPHSCHPLFPFLEDKSGSRFKHASWGPLTPQCSTNFVFFQIFANIPNSENQSQAENMYLAELFLFHEGSQARGRWEREKRVGGVICLFFKLSHYLTSHLIICISWFICVTPWLSFQGTFWLENL